MHVMKKIVLLTGSELRHNYFRKKLADDKNISMLASFCEGREESLYNRILKNNSSSELLKSHELKRFQTEQFFFSSQCKEISDVSNSFQIKKGEINSQKIINKISNLKPDLIVCYGSSIITGQLLEEFSGKFINIHLGLSPYYRGSGTNIWPLINKEPEYIGTTFMHLDNGIDTGRIIHQIRADIESEDNPHTIGCRLIKKTCLVCKQLVHNFNLLEDYMTCEPGDGKLYFRKDFTNKACEELYLALSNNLLNDYIMNITERQKNAPIFQNSIIMEKHL